MSLDIDTLFNGMVSHALATGNFEAVNTHEPDSSPGNGITCNIIFDTVEPINSSGLDSTSARVVFAMALTYPLTSEPRDATEGYLVKALDALMTAYTGDFTLGDTIRGIDCLGTYGDGLSARGAYLQVGDQHYRVIDINIPLIVNDVWAQAS